MTPEVLAGMREAFEHAWTAQPSEARVVTLRFADKPVRMRVVGELLFEQLDRCFRPLRSACTDDSMDLTIDAWDRERSGIGCPGVAYVADASDALGGGLLKQFAGGSVLHFERVHDVAALDRHRRQLLFCVDSARTTELHLRSKPFPDLLATWYRDRGVQPLHAALVARDGRGVLFVGASGAGKSTCALACALQGFDYLGDDAVGLEVAGEECIGHAWYGGARVTDAMIERFPVLATHCMQPIGRWERKAMLFVSEVRGCSTARATRIGAIVVPEISAGDRLQVSPTPPAAALRSLAPSSLLVPFGARGAGFAKLAQLVRRTPCFRMTVGDEVNAIPAAVDRILSELRT